MERQRKQQHPSVGHFNRSLKNTHIFSPIFSLERFFGAIYGLNRLICNVSFFDFRFLTSFLASQPVFPASGRTFPCYEDISASMLRIRTRLKAAATKVKCHCTHSVPRYFGERIPPIIFIQPKISSTLLRMR